MATINDSLRLQLQRAVETCVAPADRLYEKADPAHTSDAATTQHACLKSVAEDMQIVAGNVGDYSSILQLLIQAYQSSPADDFQSRLDEPLYSPGDRLLLRRAEQMIGHVQVSKLVGWFHGQRCPIARLQDFAILPEYRSLDICTPLLEVAESVAIDEGSILGLWRTDNCRWLEQHHWSRCLGQGHTRANTRAILSHLDAQRTNQSQPAVPFEIRTWRHYELDSLFNIYHTLSANMWGALQRSLETWQWLVGRKAHDQILIAVPQQSSPLDSLPDSDADSISLPAPIGYAIVRDSCIVEMLTLPGHSAVRSALLARACRDAIDRDHHFVSLLTPAADPLHELLVTAGGSWIAEADATGGQWMLKLLAPARWIERLYPVLHKRARKAGIQRPLEIDFAVDTELWRLTLTRRSSRFEPITNSSSAVKCSWRTLQDLLTSNLSFADAVASGRLCCQQSSLMQVLEALFPTKLFWHSIFPLLKL